MVSYSTNGENNNYFWRFVMLNPELSESDLDEELQVLSKSSEKAYSLLFPW
jgi:hypothetical protein